MYVSWKPKSKNSKFYYYTEDVVCLKGLINHIDKMTNRDPESYKYIVNNLKKDVIN